MVIAVVGHGPSAFSPGLQIKANQVVLMSDFKKRGVRCVKRYDYGLLNRTHKVDVCSIPLPTVAWIGYDVDVDLFGGVQVVPAGFGKFPDGLEMSRGTVATCFVITVLKPHVVLLVGFDDVMGAVRHKNWPHDNVRERDLIYQLAYQNRVEVRNV
jgi:hypothetical protein